MNIRVIANDKDIMYGSYKIVNLRNNMMVSLTNIVNSRFIQVGSEKERDLLLDIVAANLGVRFAKRLDIEVKASMSKKDEGLSNYKVKVENTGMSNISYNNLSIIKERLGYSNNKLSLQTKKEYDKDLDISVLNYNNTDIVDNMYVLGLDITDVNYWEKGNLRRLYVTTNLGDLFIDLKTGRFHIDKKNQFEYIDIETVKTVIMKELKLRSLKEVRSIKKENEKDLKQLIKKRASVEIS